MAFKKKQDLLHLMEEMNDFIEMVPPTAEGSPGPSRPWCEPHTNDSPVLINIDTTSDEQGVKLMKAVESGSVTKVKELLRKKDSKEFVNDKHGLLRVTVLHMAAYLQPNMVPDLIKHGADARVVDKLGRTPLHLACTAGNDTCVTALLQAGAEVDSQVQPQPSDSTSQIRSKLNWLKAAKPTASPLVHVVSTYSQVNNKPQPPSLQQSSKKSGTAKSKFRAKQPLPVVDCLPAADTKICSVGNQLPIPECWGRTPLHQAVKAGHPGCVRLLLNANAAVDKKDEKGLTPLLLAGAGVTFEDGDAITRYEEVVTLLVDAKADVNVLNPHTGSSALHHAAARCSIAATRLLVQKGADVSRRGANGETPLHEASHCGVPKVLEILLDAPGGEELVNRPDHVGCTPLHKAAYSGARENLALLLRHGGDLAACTYSKTSVIEAIFTYIARPVHFLNSVLDSNVQTNNAPVLDRSFKVHLDFSVLAPHGSQRQTDVLRCLLNTPGGHNHNLLMRHPLLETFLRLKWQRLRIFFFTLLAIYFCYLIILSSFVVLVHLHNDLYLKAISINSKILIVTSSFLLLHVTLQAILLPTYYLRSYETWMIATCAVSSILIASIQYDLKEMSETQCIIRDVEPHVTSITMLLAWTELMFLIGRFPIWGNYALMFYTVLQNVIKVLLTFIFIVFGFAMSFFVQFDTNPFFNNPYKAFVKTIVMMTGEFEYEDLFRENTTQHAVGANEMIPTKLTVTSRLIFLIFVVLASIVMVNLMVGLAVSDIQGIQAAGHLRRLSKQAEFVDHLEILISHRVLTKILPPCIMRLLVKRRAIVTKLTIQPSATERKHRCPHHLPHRLIEACVELAVTRRASSMKNQGNDEWPDKSFTEQRMRVDFVDQGSTNSLSSATVPMNIEEMLLSLSLELQAIKQMLAEKHQESSLPQQTLRNSSPDRLMVPRASRKNSRRSSRGLNFLTEVQGAHAVLHRMGSTK